MTGFMRFFAPFRRIFGLWLPFFPFLYFTLQIFPFSSGYRPS